MSQNVPVFAAKVDNAGRLTPLIAENLTEFDAASLGLVDDAILAYLLANPAARLYVAANTSWTLLPGTNVLSDALDASLRMRLSNDVRLSINVARITDTRAIETIETRLQHPQQGQFRLVGPTPYSFQLGTVAAVQPVYFVKEIQILDNATGKVAALTGMTPGTYPLAPSGGTISGIDAKLIVIDAAHATALIYDGGTLADVGSSPVLPTFAPPGGATMPAGITITPISQHGYDVTWNVASQDIGSIAAVTRNNVASIRATTGRRAFLLSGQMSTTALSTVLTGANSILDDRYIGPSASRWRDSASYKQPFGVLISNDAMDIDRTVLPTGLSAGLAVGAPHSLVNISGAIAYYGGSNPVDNNALGAGTLSLTAGNATVPGSGTAWLSALNPYDVIHCANGQSIKVASVEADASFTAVHGPTKSVSAQKYAIRTYHERHEGAWEVRGTDPDAAQVTIRQFTRSDIPPPRYGVRGGTMRVFSGVIDHVAAQPGLVNHSGIRFGFVDQIAFRGAYAGTSTCHGVSCGRDPEDDDNVIQGAAALTFGTQCVVMWYAGSAWSVRNGATVLGDFGIAANCKSAAFAVAQGSNGQFRHSIGVGCLYYTDPFHQGEIYVEDGLGLGNQRGLGANDDGTCFGNGARCFDSVESDIQATGGQFFGDHIEVGNSGCENDGNGNVTCNEGGCITIDGIISTASEGHGVYNRADAGMEIKHSVCSGHLLNGKYCQEGMLRAPAGVDIGNIGDGWRIGLAGEITGSSSRRLDNIGYGINPLPGTGGKAWRPSGVDSGNTAGNLAITAGVATTSLEFIYL